ncbi:hypothetical protein CMV37_10705 [Bacillus cereus]|nr:hypothetical protein CMV37_10705 [Bacillus cereus]
MLINSNYHIAIGFVNNKSNHIPKISKDYTLMKRIRGLFAKYEKIRNVKLKEVKYCLLKAIFVAHKINT